MMSNLFLQGMTNDVGFIFSVDDPTWAFNKVVLRKTRIGDTKYHPYTKL